MSLPDCPRCGRERGTWPLDRGDKCSPKDWVRCIRPLSEREYAALLGEADGA